MRRVGAWLHSQIRERRTGRRKRIAAVFDSAFIRPVTTPESLENRLLLTFDIVFDYTYDTTGFFNPQQRRDVLEAVAGIYEARITDDLTAITPGGVNNWTAIFGHPSTGSEIRLNNLTVPADTVVIYVGARTLSSLAIGGHGGFSVTGTAAFVEGIQTRGESGIDSNGSTDTDFSLWGGTISYNTNTTWNFSLDPPSAGQNDLFTVTLHELGHALGFGTAESFQNLVNGSNQFVGPATMDAYGGPVPMHTDSSHFASGTSATLPGTATVQETSMDPQITTGTRKFHTTADWAALDDLGWDIIPVAGPVDYGDAPDTATGTGPGEYQTRLLDNGPSHGIVPGLFIGSAVDSDDGSLQDASASADDNTDNDDEDLTHNGGLFFIEGLAPEIEVSVTNTTATDATLYGWIDFNKDGVFSSGTESASVSVPAGSTSFTVTLNFPTAVTGTAGATFARFRLSTDTAAAAPTGPASDGEVEDHAVSILTPTTAFDSLPLFTWPSTSGAVRYELEVNNLTTGASQFILQSELTTTSFRPPEALTPGTYNWRYRPHNGTTFLPWSDFVTFRIFATTGTPFITDPVANSIDSLPTLAWSPVESATRYELWVNETNHDRIIHQTSLSGSSFTPLSGLPAGSYTAWVRSFNGTVASAWSDPFSFALSEGNASVLTEPVGSSVNTTPTFGWLPTSAPGYTLRIDSLSAGTSDIVVAENLTGTSFTLPEGLPPGSYAATIQGAGLAASTDIRFQIQAVSGQAEFTAPFGSSENPLPVFGWTSVAGANRYELWVDNVTSGGSRVIHSSALSDTAYATQNPLAPGLYRAWVRAFGASGAIGTWSSPVDYRVREASDIPTVHAPVGTSDQAAPRFVWSSVLGATHYQVTFGYGPSGGTGPLPLAQDNVGTNSLQLDMALTAGDYEVTVTARNGVATLGSSSRRFVIAAGNGPLTIFSPLAETSNTRPVFSWSTVSNATRYVLWLNDRTRSINAAILQNNLQSPVFIPDEALLPGNYQVWIRAFNGSTPVTNWSSGLSFTVRETVASPQITGPLPNTTNSIPAITFTAVTNADSYDVQIDSVTTGTPAVVTAQGITTTVFRPTTPLAPGLYRVRVRSVTGGTVSAWSQDLELTIETAAAATLVSPLFGSSQNAADVLFAWTTVASAATYELWVNNVSTGQIKAIHDTTLTDISYTPLTALAPGRYRAWIRGIAADQSPTVWSTGVDFTVAAAQAEFGLSGNNLLVQQLAIAAQLEWSGILTSKRETAAVETHATTTHRDEQPVTDTGTGTETVARKRRSADFVTQSHNASAVSALTGSGSDATACLTDLNLIDLVLSQAADVLS